jgi:hypothetical protein
VSKERARRRAEREAAAQPAWSWRLGALAASALAWPLLVVVLFDRRSSH